jgi:hypothetical protein
VKTLEQQPAALPASTGPTGTNPRQAEELIIKEARRHQRRRYLLAALAFVSIFGAIVLVVAMSNGGGRRPGDNHHHAGTAPPRAVPPVSTPKPPGVALPSSALFNQISVTSSGLLLTGTTIANGESPESSPQSTCAGAALDPQSLAVGKLAVGSCGDPLLTGRTVEAVNTQMPQSNNATISINVADPANGQVSDGPVVMTYGSYSDTRPVIAYGTQWMWVYDNETTNGPELLQVSTASGDVVDTVRMPALYKPLLAADDGGVWIANSIGGSPAPALFYVGASSSAPSVVIADTNVPICWLQADGRSAWVGAGLQNACAKQTVERFVDYGTAPLFSVPGNFLAFTVIGDETDGLWTLQLNAGVQQIVSIDPQTGTESVAATLPYQQEPISNQEEGLLPNQAVYYEGALYILLPPFRSNGYLGYSSVVRVPVQSSQ